MSTFNIDFFELSFLAEACIPPVPIARGTFWQDLINKHYYTMTDGERSRLYTWILKNMRFDIANGDCLMFELRFNPDNQYLVQTKHKGAKETHEAFKVGGLYHVSTSTHIEPKYITEVHKQQPKHEKIN